MPPTQQVSAIVTMSAQSAWAAEGALTVYGAPEGADALILAEAARHQSGLVIHIARDASRAAALISALRFFASDLPILSFPAWDCLPYDRVSPSADIQAQRMAALSILAGHDGKTPLILVATLNAVLQRTPPKSLIEQASLTAKAGDVVDSDGLIAFLVANGFSRASTVRERGEFAVRGGLIDIFPPSQEQPVRLDFFGDSLESIRDFDPESQRSTGQRPLLTLMPASEILLNEESIALFRKNYRENFGAGSDDPLYEAVSAQRKHAGMEHWLPLFYEHTNCLFDFLSDNLVFTDHQIEHALKERLDQIRDYYEVRAKQSDAPQGKDNVAEFALPVYKPVAVASAYLDESQWQQTLEGLRHRPLSPFAPPEGKRSFSYGAKQGHNFAAERAAGGNVFEAVVEFIRIKSAENKKVLISGWSEGSAERLRSVLGDHGADNLLLVPSWDKTAAMRPGDKAVIILAIENGFETDQLVLLSEQDILGDRLVRRGKRKKAENFLTEASALSMGDLIVHVDHGIGRFDGLRTLDVQSAPHDCLQLTYAGGDKLFLPVENIELLSRYGSEGATTQLDRLGGAGWQARKSKLKQRLKMMASQLIAIAAKRHARTTNPVLPPEGAYEEFCARFAYAETEDQLSSLDDVVADMASGRPMDRLICGDVGFGKTEIALRAAFIMAMSGRQVAVIAPTTLLVRQHFKNFAERFAGFPLRLGQLSRMVSTHEANSVRAGLADGTIDVVIGTHALLSKQVSFRDLGLLVIDEEQHFGVKHKERLKEFRGDTHVLTLTATPIPRTLQLSMSGIRDLSLIATPPVDRLAVRTTIGPFDPVIARETLLREHYRGGQSFYVAPRISNLEEIAEFLTEQVPEVKFQIAHGQMSPGQLEDIMSAFYDGKFDVLVATTIIESGLDVPTANTLIVHHAELFGLAQLYQIRGRVGRSKTRAYAYITTAPNKKMTDGAARRLKVLHSLDTLGAGFSLASHDLDIRGAGNLLGEEQSGNVREVGVELYQHMLEEAVATLRDGDGEQEDTWSPQINIGTSVLIPETYVKDLDLRMALYRRLSTLCEDQEIESFAAELIDRFGPLPSEVEQLLQIITIKDLCRRANVEKIDAGPKGALISFRKDSFPNPGGLVDYITSSPYDLKIRPDQKIVFRQNWISDMARLKGCRKILALLVDIAEKP